MNLLQYITKYQIIIGAWYMVGIPLHVSGYKKDAHGDWCIQMSDKSLFRIRLPWGNERCDAPEPIVYELIDMNEGKKEHDAKYYQLKERHIVLCEKRISMHNSGRQTTMRNAYITQELELIRDQLREYKSIY